MQKNNKYYTFLLSHTTKEKIYIRRLEVSKHLLHSSAASLLLFCGVMSLGIIGLVKSDNANIASISGIDTKTNLALLKANDSNAKKVYPVKTKSIDYSDSFSKSPLNSGGPNNFDIPVELEKKLRLIEKTSSPEYLPTIWAHIGKINNEFGYRRNPFGGRSYEFHSGIDIDGEKGDFVVTPANGVVKKAGWQGGYGRLIEIDHGNGLTTRYGHLSKLEVKEGDRVRRGQLIALVGSTGRSTGPHLHYELRVDKKAINPRRFLPPEPFRITK